MLGEYLKKYRLEKNLTQKQMALKLKINHCYYCSIERDKLKPGIQTINSIAKLLKIEPMFVRGLL